MMCDPCREAAKVVRQPEVTHQYLFGHQRTITGQETARLLHAQCREVRRQADPGLTAVEKAGGHWCACQHNLPRDLAQAAAVD